MQTLEIFKADAATFTNAYATGDGIGNADGRHIDAVKFNSEMLEDWCRVCEQSRTDVHGVVKSNLVAKTQELDITSRKWVRGDQTESGKHWLSGEEQVDLATYTDWGQIKATYATTLKKISPPKVKDTLSQFQDLREQAKRAGEVLQSPVDVSFADKTFSDAVHLKMTSQINEGVNES